jgi:hypothetical protein
VQLNLREKPDQIIEERIDKGYPSSRFTTWLDSPSFTYPLTAIVRNLTVNSFAELFTISTVICGNIFSIAFVVTDSEVVEELVDWGLCPVGNFPALR